MSLRDLDDDLSLEGHLERFWDNRAEELHTALPGRVVRYESAHQTVDVEPTVRRSIPATDGSRVREPMPTIRAVPVAWPRAGGFFVHMPIAAGDFVLLVCCERDLARWRVTGELSDPIDRRSHHLSHAVAIPGLYPRTRELADTPSDALVIGHEGGATIRIRDDGEIHVGSAAAELVALSNLVADQLTALKNAISGAAVLANDGGATFKTNILAALAAWPGSVAASKTRAE